MKKRHSPEEVVREGILLQMTTLLGYPKELIAVERSLSSMPHLQGKDVPNRRFDITCFAKDIHPEYPLYPLLIIECKKEILTEETVRQLIGYNATAKACFLAVANGEEVLMIFSKGKENSYRFVKGLMRYEELMAIQKGKV